MPIGNSAEICFCFLANLYKYSLLFLPYAPRARICEFSVNFKNRKVKPGKSRGLAGFVMVLAIRCRIFREGSFSML